jgi:hypothetical protein
MFISECWLMILGEGPKGGKVSSDDGKKGSRHPQPSVQTKGTKLASNGSFATRSVFTAKPSGHPNKGTKSIVTPASGKHDVTSRLIG